MSKVIFTADDYGVVPAIDEGIIKAVKLGKVNSVAAFSNYDTAIDSIKRLIDETQGADLEVGCHLTITSGEPLTENLKRGNSKNFVRRNGFFRKFTQMRRPVLKKRLQEIKDLENELIAQVQRMLDNGIEVKHLSSHHNSLYFFEDYADTLFEVAKKFNLPVRSPINKPDKQQNLYIFQLVLRLFDNMLPRDKRHVKQFMKDPEGYLSRRVDKPKMPEFLDSTHYGPAPMPLFNLNLERIEKEASDKVGDMKDRFKELGEEETVEFVFHIIENTYDQLDNYEKQVNGIEYSGINADYFDGRMAEFRSLEKLMLPPNVTYGKWSDL